MNIMKRAISPIDHGRGLATCSGSTSSVGIGTCEKSYNRLLVRILIGAIGK